MGLPGGSLCPRVVALVATSCSTCATYLRCTYHYREVAVIAVRGGTLDDTSTVRPQAHIFTRSMQPWFGPPKDVPSFVEAYDRAEVWPPDSLKKYQRLARKLSQKLSGPIGG